MQKNPPQTILYVHNYYKIPGGEATVVANEIKLLRDHGHKVILYSRNNQELDGMNPARKLLLPFSTIFNIRTYREIKKIIKEQQVDIVHVHNTLNLVSPAVYYAARSAQKPVVQTIHNFRLLCPAATFYRDGHVCEDCVNHGLTCALKHRCYRNSFVQTLACVLSTGIHRILGIYGKINYICLTDFNKEKLLQLKQIKQTQVYVKPNFSETAGKVRSMKERQGMYIYVGRLEELKGSRQLLQAFKILEEKGGTQKLVIYGSGPLENRCHEFIRENQLQNITLNGFIPHKKVLEKIADARALLLPTQWYEGFPMTIVEAFSVGTPVIASRLGNVASVIEHGETGLLFSHESAEQLAETILQYEEMDMQKMSEQAHKIYSEQYSKEANYERMCYIYESVK